MDANEAKKEDMIYGEVVAKCWEDEAYKKRFLADPEAVLQEAGFEVEEGVTYQVIEAPKLVEYLVLPAESPQKATQAVARAFLAKAEKSDTIIPEGAEVRIIQNSEDTRYLILPASPKTLTKAELALVAGGDTVVTATNVAQTAEIATSVVEVEAVATSTTTVAEAEIVVGAVVVVGIVVAVI